MSKLFRNAHAQQNVNREIEKLMEKKSGRGREREWARKSILKCKHSMPTWDDNNEQPWLVSWYIHKNHKQTRTGSFLNWNKRLHFRKQWLLHWTKHKILEIHFLLNSRWICACLLCISNANSRQVVVILENKNGKMN